MEVSNGEMMKMRAALLLTTSTPGWAFIEKFSDAVVRDIERDAVAEDDDAKANGLRHDARGARKFRDYLMERIALAKTQTLGDEGFNEILMEADNYPPQGEADGASN
jgi:hypothetical protein